MPENQESPSTNVENKSLLNWTAPIRPFKRASREFYIKSLSVGALFGVILFLIDGVLPVILLISLGFLIYVYTTVEPGHTGYSITTQGIKIHDKLTPWHSMGRFWFAPRLGSELLIIEAATFGGRLELVIDPSLQEQIKTILSKYITYEQVPPTTTDKIISWFSTKVLS